MTTVWVEKNISRNIKRFSRWELSESENERAAPNPFFLGQIQVYSLLNPLTAGMLKRRKIKWEALCPLNGWGNLKLCSNVCFKRASASLWQAWAELDHTFSLSMKPDQHMQQKKICSFPRHELFFKKNKVSNMKQYQISWAVHRLVLLSFRRVYLDMLCSLRAPVSQVHAQQCLGNWQPLKTKKINQDTHWESPSGPGWELKHTASALC